MTLRPGSPTTAGCPILDAFLFLRLGWETSNLKGSSVHAEAAR
jgi:hypothetical protein